MGSGHSIVEINAKFLPFTLRCSYGLVKPMQNNT
jgi:hypothetical protein